MALPTQMRMIMAVKYETKKKRPLEASFWAAMRARKFATVACEWAKISVEHKRRRKGRSLRIGRYLTPV